MQGHCPKFPNDQKNGFEKYHPKLQTIVTKREFGSK
jgi:hypothetical protein